MYPIINILGREIGSYALLAVIGVICCGFLSAYMGNRRGIAFDSIIIAMLWTVGGMLVGGHLLYGITNLPMMLTASPTSITELFKVLIQGFGGMVFYGGFIGAAITVFVYKKHSSAPNTEFLPDIFAVSVPLFHFFGRLGCFLGGCCYGIESKFGLTVYNNPISPSINGVNRFPVQPLEALCNLIIFAVLFALYKKEKCKERLIYLYMIFYPLVRFFTEMLRGDEIRGIWHGLSTSQWISICLLIFSVGKLIKLYK